MNTEPDGVEVVASAAHARDLSLPPLLVLDELRRYLDESDLGSGNLSWQRIGEGHANITYLIRRGDDAFVLRRGPRPPHPPSTHDMIREARIQQLVADIGVPVPEIVAVCEDRDVIGVPFYVMTYLDGVVITSEVPQALGSAAQRRATGFAAIDSLAQLHLHNVGERPLAGIGRPDGYLERQVRRFMSLWNQATERSVPGVHTIGTWLAANVPTSQRASVVHGDFRLGNLMFAREAPVRIEAILDWEMATLGDPLADLGYFVATYATPTSAITPIELTTATREPGYPTRDELIGRYAATTGLDVTDLGWYQALALWKAAIFCEAMYTRWLHGQRPGDTFAPTLEQGVPALVEGARRFIGHS